MLAVIKKLTYDDEYNFENEVSVFDPSRWSRRTRTDPAPRCRARTRPCSWSTGSS